MNSRASSLGFADRTKKNLEYVRLAYERGKDVHDVTQIVNSLLGLIVFPWAESFDEKVKGTRLDDLEKDGWPEWKVTLGSCETLGQLIHKLRNGTSHRHLQFSSDSRVANEVEITFWDQKTKSTHRHWEARIMASDLRVFCVKFADLLEDTIG